MHEIRLRHTHQLDVATRDAIRALLDDAFRGDFADSDWEHALGGIHVLAITTGRPGTLVGHAAVVQRRLLHGGRALRAGYVEAVATAPEHRGRGIGRALMRALDPVITGAYDLGALAATAEAVPLYERAGWRRWQGPTYALTPDGVVRTPDADDAVHVRSGTVDRTRPLTCDWRDGDVW